MVISFGRGYDKTVESDILLLDISNNDEYYIWTTTFDPKMPSPPPSPSSSSSSSLPSLSPSPSPSSLSSPSSNNSGKIAGAVVGSLLSAKTKTIYENENDNDHSQEEKELSTIRDIQEIILSSENENTTNHEPIIRTLQNENTTSNHEPIIPELAVVNTNNYNYGISTPNNNNRISSQFLKDEIIQVIKQEIGQNLKNEILQAVGEERRINK
ncbi:unnamed protein product [Rhizophagus irregularis]|nr:unnamed protein product [Rhizophagus irregularis]